MDASSGVGMKHLLVGLLYLTEVYSFLPFQNPPWEPTYDLGLSTIAMMINASGPYNQTQASHFGIASYDWSSEKAQWVNSRPMDCEERMLAEAKATKAANPNSRPFVYRNLVKALPWFSSVRKIIDDPAYEGFFLRFDKSVPVSKLHVPPCTTQNNVTKCSNFYHDQEQTPNVPTPSNPNPDGACDLYCDCGSVPCGEYLFDHRNGSMLTEWLLSEYILSDTAMGSPVVSGMFIDDFWCSDIINGTGNCNDPVQGPSEIDKYSQIDMGLSDYDIADITIGWLENMEIVQNAILKAGGYTWSLILGQDNANAMPIVVTNSTTCLAFLNETCSPDNPYLDSPLLYGVTYEEDSEEYPYLLQQVATFLLSRGPFGYLGMGVWGMTWPQQAPFPDLIWKGDYGTPIDPHCYRLNNNTFARSYSNAFVTVDCDSWTATIKSQEVESSHTPSS
eukprot:TRINITY_DN5990_c0_g1_i2.p1 TRINITY_DN5990_c0_g1~~TRINITY_DN5990_c0_g1_i2.p1  ORF type:complete len:447 (-),score=72.88 TRINITY_DN5990_c0_g1_i2:49-1389(-)